MTFTPKNSVGSRDLVGMLFRNALHTHTHRAWILKWSLPRPYLPTSKIDALSTIAPIAPIAPVAAAHAPESCRGHRAGRTTRTRLGASWRDGGGTAEHTDGRVWR